MINYIKLWRAHIHNACFLRLMVAGQKKNLSLQSGHCWYRQHRHRCSIRPPPPICPIAHANSFNTRCCWLVQLGEGAGFPEAGGGISHPSVPSHRASRPCQPSLGEIVRTFPFEGVYGAALNNRYQKPPAWNCPLATGRVSLVRGDQRETASIWGLCIQR